MPAAASMEATRRAVDIRPVEALAEVEGVLEEYERLLPLLECTLAPLFPTPASWWPLSAGRASPSRPAERPSALERSMSWSSALWSSILCSSSVWGSNGATRVEA